MNDHDAAQTVESGVVWSDLSPRERRELDDYARDREALVTMSEEEAARFVRAALRMMWERIPATNTGLRTMVAEFGKEMDGAFADALFAPWSTEPDGPAVARTWAEVCEGDWVQGGDKGFYLVKANRPSNGEQHVTIQVKGEDRTYPRQSRVFAQVKRGPTGMAMDVLEQAGLNPSVLASGD